MIEPGKPEESPLIEAISHSARSRCRPRRNSPLRPIADLAEWVKMGAPWPEPVTAATAGRQAPPRPRPDTTGPFSRRADPPLPAVKDQDWPRTSVDRFILARLEAKGLSPSPPADRRTLIRRATFDLTGLPPTPEEIAAFEADPSPEAYTRLIDRLLASPHYGERWARHWLDVARYSDTKGYVFFQDAELSLGLHLPRLRDPLIQRRSPLRSLPRRADRRRPLAAGQ